VGIKCISILVIAVSRPCLGNFPPQIEQNVQGRIIQKGKKPVNYDHFTGGNSILSEGALWKASIFADSAKKFDKQAKRLL
jgi:hypothetical protein